MRAADSRHNVRHDAGRAHRRSASIVIGLTWIATVMLDNPFDFLYASLFFTVLGGGIWLIRGTKGPAPRNGDRASW